MSHAHVLLLLIVLTADLAAQTGNCTTIDASTRPDCPGALKFFARVQRAIRADDRQTVAALINYPMLTRLNHKRIHIRSRKELLSHFDQVFDADTRCAILGATERDVWGNWRGFSIGDGAIWFDAIIPPAKTPDIHAPDYWTKYPFKIITVNNGDTHHCKHP
jgi:hypothetical protein